MLCSSGAAREGIPENPMLKRELHSRSDDVLARCKLLGPAEKLDDFDSRDDLGIRRDPLPLPQLPEGCSCLEKIVRLTLYRLWPGSATTEPCPRQKLLILEPLSRIVYTCARRAMAEEKYWKPDQFVMHILFKTP